MIELPSEYIREYYKEYYPDLQNMADDEIDSHYQLHGRDEGRVSSPAALREKFVPIMPIDLPLLEIGPFCNPMIIGENVSYFDVLNGEALRQRAEYLKQTIVQVPEIDYVSDHGDLSIVDRKFDAVASSHCVEHQPDLVYHLKQVERILNEGGRYFLIVPDKRYCFDYSLPESNLGEVLQSWHSSLRNHSLGSLIKYRALTTHNVTSRHWANDHYDEGWGGSVATKSTDAIREFVNSGGSYIDVHAWQFTPDTFRFIMRALFDMGLVGLSVERVYHTPWGRNEFTAVLRKTAIAC